MSLDGESLNYKVSRKEMVPFSPLCKPVLTTKLIFSVFMYSDAWKKATIVYKVRGDLFRATVEKKPGGW